MCEHCGCRGVPSVAELMDEHYALLDDSHAVRRALGDGDRVAAVGHLRRLVDHLAVHVRREERGIFTAMREQGDFVDEVSRLEGEHRWLDEAVADLDPSDPGFTDTVGGLLSELSDHIDRENLGIFPVSVVSLGGAGWDLVGRVHDEFPTFLPDRADAG